MVEDRDIVYAAPDRARYKNRQLFNGIPCADPSRAPAYRVPINAGSPARYQLVIGTATGNASNHGLLCLFVADANMATGPERLILRGLWTGPLPAADYRRGASATPPPYVTIYNPNTILGIYNRKSASYLAPILGQEFKNCKNPTCNAVSSRGQFTSKPGLSHWRL